MTQNLDTNGVIKTPDCSFEQFQPTNVNQTNAWELGLQCAELLAKFCKELVEMNLNSQNPQLSSPTYSQKRKEQIEIEQYIKKHKA